MQKWKFFEQIISLIEHGLKTDESTIVSHDIRLIDQLGIKRQIDVYIVTQINGHPVRVVVECKDHANRIKLKDIDDFDSKTKRLAIDKRIYVAKTGYQAGAVKAAKALGIELCTLSDISSETVKSWLQIPGLQLINHLYNFLNIRFNLKKDTNINTISKPFDIESSIYSNDKKTKVGTAEIRQNLVNQLGKSEPDFFEPEKTKKVIFNFPGNAYYLKIKNEFYRVENIEAVIQFQIQQHNYPVSSIKRYSQIEGENLADVASVEFPAMSQEFIMSFVKSEKDGLTRVVVAPKKIKKP